jgi:hypothetical protein
MTRTTLIVVTTMLALLVLAAPALSATSTVTLAWDYGTTPTDLAGFRIYAGKAAGVVANSANKVAEVAAAARQAQVPNLADGKACFVATAFDANGNESAKSNEVCVDLDTTAPPVPGNIRVEVTIKVESTP